MSSMSPTDIAWYTVAGGAIGAIYFVLLRHTVQRQASRAAAAPMIPLFLLRLAAAVSAFWAIAQQGAAPLLLALLGFMIARMVVQRSVGKV